MFSEFFVKKVEPGSSSDEDDDEQLLKQWHDRSSTKPRKAFVTYEKVVWMLIGISTLLAVLDRFTTNVWPRQSFTIGAGTAGTDRMGSLKAGPWSVQVYDILARVSGRISICSFNWLLLVRLQSLEHFIASVGSSCQWVVVDCDDIIHANLRIHRWNGIALCALTLLHVWSILLPCITHGYKAKIIPGYFEWPLSERAPMGFRDADPTTETMMLQVDDVWRLCEMTLGLGVLMPLSVRWLAKRWHIGMPLHQFIMILYFVDIVRRHSHPHSWVLNTPIFVVWIADKLMWQTRGRRMIAPSVHRIQLDRDYMVLFWNTPQAKPIHTIGPDYSLRLRDSTCMEGRHVFTCFENRSLSSSPSSLFSLDLDWSAGTVIRVFRNSRRPISWGTQDKVSHTQRIMHADSLDKALTVWGPTYGEVSQHVLHAMQQAHHPVVLVGGGSGVGYLLDAVQQWVATTAGSFMGCNHLTLLFTTRSKALHRFVHHMILRVLEGDSNEEDVGTLPKKKRKSQNIRVVLAWTGSAGSANEKDVEEPSEIMVPTSDWTYVGRIDFDAHIEQGDVVFCQGGAALTERVATVCRQRGARFFGGRGGS